MRAVALALSVSLLSYGCFPNNPKARTYAKVGEGASLGAGILVEALTNAGADCTTNLPGMPDSGCKDSASFWGGAGVVLILAGLLGFVATISTTPDDDNKPHQEIKAVQPQPTTPTPAAAPTPMPAAAPGPTPPTAPSGAPGDTPPAPAPAPAGT